MSLYLEESPQSDSKMDISDVTTSLDSAGISPVAEEEEEQQQKVDVNDDVDMQMQNNAHSPLSPAANHNHNEHVPKALPLDTHNEDDDIGNDATKTTAARLDNRIKRPEMLLLDTTPQRQNIARTLANSSHPLMSPTGTDSDSEQGHVKTQQQQHHNQRHHQQQQQQKLAMDQKCHNFPDVVPRSERLQTSNAEPNTVTVRNTLNNMRVGGVSSGSGKLVTTPAHNKLVLLRAHSPDLLSSESDADVSQYHAAVKGNFQAVALVSNIANGGITNKGGGLRRARKTGIAATGCDDISSLDSISNHSFDDDEDLEHNLASLSPSSSLIDGLDDDDDDDDDDCEGPELLPDEDYDDDFMNATTPTANAPILLTDGVAEGEAPDALPQYTAAEERRDSRNWQKITLPDGRTREIDMRVIEPYKRVLSHGGYLKAGGHNAIVIFCACHLPDRSRADYNYVMDNLFLYVVKTLEQLVTEDYVLIYLHGGTNRRNVPPFPWLKKCYQLLDRRLRKSLKNMYLVHPTFWIKSIVWMARPFVSAKFWRKLIYVRSLEELNTHVAVEKAAIPEKVKQYDAKHN